ncbi:hypothetical protein PDJAM_G00040610 [Pangasius djambal]|uniref:Uncharacterized protein n=1 Tax=Pangasius djambal TaxID=1691987 RepID=A0ACC5YSY7_9TELE|nr:hypothetical protein [Pangasius djambal]
MFRKRSAKLKLLSRSWCQSGPTIGKLAYAPFVSSEPSRTRRPLQEPDGGFTRNKSQIIKTQAGWKQYRQAVLECVDGFLQELSADTPHTHTAGGGGGTGSVCERFKQAMEKQQILPVLQNTHSEPQRLVLLLDDNFYYHSMRYRVHQLARRHAVGFCEVYLHCPLEVCLHRNRVRGQPVSDDVITEMSNRMEPPNTEKNQWEKNSVTVDSTHTQAGWKQYRQAVLECVDGFLQELSADTPHTHTAGGGGGGGGTGSVCERFKQAMEKQQILPVLQNTHSEPQRLVLLLDDNFYYHSMRYRVHQLARRHAVGFCEVYLHCPLEVCLHRNRVRGQPVSDDVITEMSNRMEPPNTEKNQWEKNSVTVDSTHTEADRQRCACSVVHQVDQVCRRLVSQAMLTARACTRSGEELKALARELSDEKTRFLQELRAQVLQQLGQDECVCVERVVHVATDTFTRRTRVTMERHGVGVHATSSS